MPFYIPPQRAGDEIESFFHILLINHAFVSHVTFHIQTVHAAPRAGFVEKFSRLILVFCRAVSEHIAVGKISKCLAVAVFHSLIEETEALFDVCLVFFLFLAVRDTEFGVCRNVSHFCRLLEEFERELFILSEILA